VNVLTSADIDKMHAEIKAATERVTLGLLICGRCGKKGLEALPHAKLAIEIDEPGGRESTRHIPICAYCLKEMGWPHKLALNVELEGLPEKILPGYMKRLERHQAGLPPDEERSEESKLADALERAISDLRERAPATEEKPAPTPEAPSQVYP
jgi:hypothetical protein